MMKKVFIEKIRIIAIILVIFNHTDGISAFISIDNPIKRTLYLIPAVICKIAVPLFFMISGYLLLGRDTSISSNFKRIGKKLVELCFITVLYMIYKNIRWGSNYTISNFPKLLYTGNGLSSHLWFMYAYIGFLLGLPILNFFAVKANSKIIKYLLIIILGIKGIETTQYIVLNNSVALSQNIIPSWLLADIFVFPIVGYYFGNNKNWIKRKVNGVWLVCIAIMGISIELIETLILGNRTGGTYAGVNFQMWFSHYVLFLALAVFVYFSRNGEINNPGRFDKLFFKLGGVTYGVYVFHIIIKDLPFMKAFLGEMVQFGIDFIIADIIYVIVTYVITAMIVYILKLFSAKFKMYKNEFVSKIRQSNT